MITDNKKVQSMINRLGWAMIDIRKAVTDMDNIKTLFQNVNPNITGTALEGNVATINAAFTALKTETDKAIWNTLINNIVPTHKGEALNG